MVATPSHEPTPSPDQSSDTREASDEQAIHRNFSTWHLVPPAHLQTILESIEPNTFSGGNLRTFVKKGCRAAPRQILLELLEFTVDVDPLSCVGEDRTLSTIIAKFKVINLLNGRRGRD